MAAIVGFGVLAFNTLYKMHKKGNQAKVDKPISDKRMFREVLHNKTKQDVVDALNSESAKFNSIYAANEINPEDIITSRNKFRAEDMELVPSNSERFTIGGNPRSVDAVHNMHQRKLDILSGANTDKLYKHKQERKPLFDPQETYTDIYKTQSLKLSERAQQYVIPSKYRNDEVLMEPVRQGRGLNLGYNTVHGSSAKNDFYRAEVRDINKLRVENNHKVEYPGGAGAPQANTGKQYGQLGELTYVNRNITVEGTPGPIKGSYLKPSSDGDHTAKVVKQTYKQEAGIPKLNRSNGIGNSINTLLPSDQYAKFDLNDKTSTYKDNQVGIHGTQKSYVADDNYIPDMTAKDSTLHSQHGNIKGTHAKGIVDGEREYYLSNHALNNDPRRNVGNVTYKVGKGDHHVKRELQTTAKDTLHTQSPHILALKGKSYMHTEPHINKDTIKDANPHMQTGHHVKGHTRGYTGSQYEFFSTKQVNTLPVSSLVNPHGNQVRDVDQTKYTYKLDQVDHVGSVKSNAKGIVSSKDSNKYTYKLDQVDHVGSVKANSKGVVSSKDSNKYWDRTSTTDAHAGFIGNSKQGINQKTDNRVPDNIEESTVSTHAHSNISKPRGYTSSNKVCDRPAPEYASYVTPGSSLTQRPSVAGVNTSKSKLVYKPDIVGQNIQHHGAHSLTRLSTVNSKEVSLPVENNRLFVSGNNSKEYTARMMPSIS